MTSAVHGGIHNVSRHLVGVGRVDIMSSIHELVVLQNQVLIYSPTNLRLSLFSVYLGNFRPVNGQCCFVPPLARLPGTSHLAGGLITVVQKDA